MDSITHIALGACLGEVLLSKKIGKKSLLLGALAQSLPDIDVVAALWLSPTQNLLVHRGLTHSFLFGIIAALVLSFVLHQLWFRQHLSFFALSIFFCLQIWLHDILDTCNAYGTGLLEPFSHQRFSFHLLYVADIFFSVSIVIAFIMLVFLSSRHPARNKWVFIGLFPAAIYLVYAVVNKTSVNQQVEKTLAAKHIAYQHFFTTPTPANTWLWYTVATTDKGYLVGYRSVFDKETELLNFTYYPRNQHLLHTIDKKDKVNDLLRFADKYYTVEQWNDTLVFNVLRFGQILGWQEPKAKFAFHYFLNPASDNLLVLQRGRFKGWNKRTLNRMYNRIKGNKAENTK